MWILIDNYDSFSFILLDYLRRTGFECRLFRNDEITVDELEALAPDRIIISPGPETPAKAGICMEVIDRFHQRIPILGVCLGHQALGAYFGARLVHAAYPMHGKVSRIRLEDHSLFRGLPKEIEVMRYHSLVLEGLETSGFEVIARAQDDNAVMAIAHRQFPLVGFQFHPESVGTTEGLSMLTNWALTRGL